MGCASSSSIPSTRSTKRPIKRATLKSLTNTSLENQQQSKDNSNRFSFPVIEEIRLKSVSNGEENYSRAMRQNSHKVGSVENGENVGGNGYNSDSLQEQPELNKINKFNEFNNRNKKNNSERITRSVESIEKVIEDESKKNSNQKYTLKDTKKQPEKCQHILEPNTKGDEKLYSSHHSQSSSSSQFDQPFDQSLGDSMLISIISNPNGKRLPNERKNTTKSTDVANSSEFFRDFDSSKLENLDDELKSHYGRPICPKLEGEEGLKYAQFMGILTPEQVKWIYKRSHEQLKQKLGIVGSLDLVNIKTIEDLFNLDHDSPSTIQESDDMIINSPETIQVINISSKDPLQSEDEKSKNEESCFNCKSDLESKGACW